MQEKHILVACFVDGNVRFQAERNEFHNTVRTRELEDKHTEAHRRYIYTYFLDFYFGIHFIEFKLFNLRLQFKIASCMQLYSLSDDHVSLTL